MIYSLFARQLSPVHQTTTDTKANTQTQAQRHDIDRFVVIFNNIQIYSFPHTASCIHLTFLLFYSPALFFHRFMDILTIPLFGMLI